MAQFTHIIFDLDGTLTDNTQGIGNSIKYALARMQIDDYSEEILTQFIGPPLQWGFKTLFGMNERNTELAVGYFREYFAVKGMYENVPYPGISEMLGELNNAGKQLFIATSKLEKYAIKIVEHFEFDRYILQVYGSDYSGKRGTKSAIIKDLLESRQLKPSSNVAMIGDTVFDVEGGKENQLSTVAVGYGFGKEKALRNAGPDYLVHTVEELYETLI